MDVQAILDRTALIAGGAIFSAERGVYKGAGGIAGVKVAYAKLPEPDLLAEDGIVHISWYDGTEILGDEGDLTRFVHRIRMQAMVKVARAELPYAIGVLTPLFPLYFDALRQQVRLNGAASGGSRLVRADGIKDGLYPDRIALDMTLLATEEESVSYIA